MGQMWSWQSEADGIAMAVDVMQQVQGGFLPVLENHPQRTRVGLQVELQSTNWVDVSLAVDLSPAALLISSPTS